MTIYMVFAINLILTISGVVFVFVLCERELESIRKTYHDQNARILENTKEVLEHVNEVINTNEKLVITNKELSSEIMDFAQDIDLLNDDMDKLREETIDDINNMAVIVKEAIEEAAEEVTPELIERFRKELMKAINEQPDIQTVENAFSADTFRDLDEEEEVTNNDPPND